MPEKDRREQILASARRCFIENGYHPTRMDDIAKTAKLSKGGVYFHFKSKKEVFESLVKEEYETSMAFIKQVTESEASILEKMQVLGGYYLSYFTQKPDAPRFFIVMGEMSLRDQELAKLLLEMQSNFINEVAKLIEQGTREGYLREIDSVAVAAILKALLDGIEGLAALGYSMEGTHFLQVGIELVMNGLRRTETQPTPA